MLSEIIRQTIRKEVCQNGYRDTATQTGITVSTLHRFIGGGQISVETLEKLLDYYAVEMKTSD